MNKTIAAIIISLLLAITGFMVYLAFFWSKPSKKNQSSNSTTTTTGGTTTTTTPTPADVTPGESPSSPTENNPDFITIRFRSNTGMNIYNFDTDPNNFNAGDSIFALKELVIFDEEENSIDVQPMQMIGYFMSRDLNAILINNNDVTYKVPGINPDKKIAKLINT